MKSITEGIVASYDSRMKATRDRMKDVQKTVRDLASARKHMGAGQAKALADGETARMKSFKDMLGNIQKGIKDIETYVENKLKEFNDAHAEMSEQQKKDLANYVSGIANEVKKLLGEYGSEMAKAKAVWQGMAASLAKSRKPGVMPRIEAEGKATTVEGAVEKKGKKKSGKKRGKKNR
ncbi:MAG: hypothetical protein HY922_03655 [Elusimicrobia bacterium]|nr:hypothetical protein [Elusimicrobiota bacterium]